MRNTLIVLAILLVGCTWADVDKNVAKVTTYAEKGAQAAAPLAPANPAAAGLAAALGALALVGRSYAVLRGNTKDIVASFEKAKVDLKKADKGDAADLVFAAAGQRMPSLAKKLVEKLK